MEIWLNINLTVAIIVCACIVFARMVLDTNEIEEPEWYKLTNGAFVFFLIISFPIYLLVKVWM